MTHEQFKRVEELLVSMIENVPEVGLARNANSKIVNADGMSAAADVARTLIALHECAAKYPPQEPLTLTVRVTIDGIPLRCYKRRVPDSGDGGGNQKGEAARNETS